MKLANCPMCGRPNKEIRPLTMKQRLVYLFIKAYITDCGFSPSYQEIADHFGYRSLATVHEHVDNLIRRGWVERGYNERRSIRVVAV